jgi:hypothetical protein
MTGRITLVHIVQHAINLAKQGPNWEGIQINESGITYKSEENLRDWYVHMLITLKGDKANIPRPESTQRTMINFGMYAQRLPNRSIFRPFPSGPASQWKWPSKAERMKVVKPMCPKTQAAAKKAKGSFSLEVLSEAASKLPEKVYLKFNLPKTRGENCEEEEMVYEEDADYSVGI